MRSAYQVTADVRVCSNSERIQAGWEQANTLAQSLWSLKTPQPAINVASVTYHSVVGNIAHIDSEQDYRQDVLWYACTPIRNIVALLKLMTTAPSTCAEARVSVTLRKLEYLS